MSIRLCVLLWPVEGRDADLRSYEDAVLPLLGEHAGRLIARETVVRDSSEEPLEVQMIELEDQAALEAYMSDPRRKAREEDRTLAVRRTQILHLA